MSRDAALECIETFGKTFVQYEAAHDRDLAEEITVVIKTFERPTCVAWAITSLRTFFPSIKALVCDDSREPLYEDQFEPLPGVTWLLKPYEDGHTVGAGRNFLIDRVGTKFFFLSDDDVQFAKKTDLRAMRDFLENHQYDLVGASQSPWDYGTANFELKGRSLIEKHYAHSGEIAPGVVKCDRVSNAFLARRDTVSQVRWEGAVGRNEHADFFYRAMLSGLKIAQMGRIYMTHKRNCEPCDNIRDRIHGLLHGHRSKAYRISMYGGGESEETARLRHLRLYQEHILDKNNIDKIIDDKSLLRKFRLFMTIGHPSLNFSKPISSAQG